MKVANRMIYLSFTSLGRALYSLRKTIDKWASKANRMAQKYSDGHVIKKRPVSIREFVKEHNGDQSLVKDIIELYREHQIYWTQNCCAICDQELSDEDLEAITQHSYNRTCSMHRKYDRIYDTSFIRRELGYPERPLFT